MLRALCFFVAVSALACGRGTGRATPAENLSPEELAAIAYQALWEPSPSDLAVQAPDSFSVSFETSAGDIMMTFYRDWAPLGVDRVYHLTRYNFYAGARFYRVNPGVAQFGLTGQPALDSIWRNLPMQDDTVVGTNTRGTVAFARSGPNSRDAQLFINIGDNAFYDTCCGGGFPPIGRVVSGMEAVDSLYNLYGETPSIYADSIMIVGNDFLRQRYPRLDTIAGTTVDP